MAPASRGHETTHRVGICPLLGLGRSVSHPVVMMGGMDDATTRRPIPVRTIDCGDCAMHDTQACDDCVVSFVLSREPGDALVIDAAEERALRALGDAGLVPHLRHRPRRIV